MKQIDLGQTIAILANVGVIAGIVFLGIELQQNNEYMAASSRYDMLQNQVALMDQIAASPELSELVVRAAEPEALSQADQLRLFMLATKVLRNWQWEFEEYRAGRLSLEQLPIFTWRTFFNGQTGILVLPFDQVWNAGMITQSNPDFANFMEEKVIDR